MERNLENILHELARAYGKKPSKCRIFDANVCTWGKKTEKPWELLPLAGSPFSQYFSIKRLGVLVKAVTNGTYLGLLFESEISLEPLSLDRKSVV